MSIKNFTKLNSRTTLYIKQPSGDPENTTPLDFTITPSSQTVQEGEIVILECSGNGNPKPMINWFHHGIEIDLK